jgi:hypothetical protein
MQKRKNIISKGITEFIKTHKRFSLEDVITATGFERRAILPFLNRLCREEYLKVEKLNYIRSKKKEVGPYEIINPTYCRLKDLFLRLSKHSENGKDKRVSPKKLINPSYRRLKDLALRAPKCPESNRDKIWRTLRYLRKATRSDLVRLTECKPEEVKNYTVILANHQYIRAIGNQDREKVWLLVKDTGPKRPIISQKKEEKE